MLLVDRAAMSGTSVRPFPAGMDVSLGALPAGILAVWVHLGGLDGVTVAECVQSGAVAAVVRHLRTHASDAVAQVLGLVVCDAADCPTALDWLTEDVQPTTVTSSA